MNQYLQNKNGALWIDGVQAQELAQKYKTPLYIYSKNAILDQIAQLKADFLDVYEDVRVAYASKAFSCMGIYKLMEKEGLHLDIVSGGELFTAEKMGYPMAKIEFNGNNKSYEELEMAISLGVGRIIVDGLDELDLIEEICQKLDKKTQILYQVGAIKEIPGIGKYVSVDGGMSDNIRPALYGEKYTAIHCSASENEETEKVSISGKCCESGDILIKEIDLPKLKRGDLLAVLSTGAYGYSMASNYNKNPIPAAVLVWDGNDDLLIQRQSYEQIIQNERIPSSLI